MRIGTDLSGSVEVREKKKRGRVPLCKPPIGKKRGAELTHIPNKKHDRLEHIFICLYH